MKNTAKALSFILAAVTITSSAATMASAGNIWKNEDMLGNTPSVTEVQKNKDNKCTTNHVFVGTSTKVVKASDHEDSTIYTNKTTTETKGCFAAKDDFVIKTTFRNPCGLYGAKYYSKADAKAYIEQYFNTNSYDVYMTEEQAKTFCKDAYYYSSDPDVVYYDYKTGTLVAGKSGTAEVYLYTKGGLPFFKLNVYVSRKFSNTKDNPTLNIVPDEWRLDIGDTTEFTVTASDGKTYDDIEFSVKLGANRVTLTQNTHKLTADKNGAVVVYAYSKSNPDICGETVLYVGQYEYAVQEGCWAYDKDCIKINDWYCGWSCDDYYSSITGWIKSVEGIFIPVIKLSDATVDRDGEKQDTVIARFDTIPYIDLIRQAYGDKDAISAIIKKYNLYKYGFYDTDGDFCGKIDPRYFYMSQLFN